MRIVHISDCYPPRLGGIETQVRALAVRQAEQGHDVHVITATPSDTMRKGTEVLDGVVVHRATVRMPAELPVHPRVVPVLRTILGPHGVAKDADAVHVHGGVVSPFAYPGAKVARDLGLPTVVTIHGVWGGVFSPMARLADLLTHWTRWGVALTAVSDAAADPIRAIVGPDVPVTLVPNGIDVERWRIPHVAGDPAETRVVAVMRLAPRKRSMALVKMGERAVEQLPDGRRLRLTIVGEGPELRVYGWRQRVHRDSDEVVDGGAEIRVAHRARFRIGEPAGDGRCGGLLVLGAVGRCAPDGGAREDEGKAEGNESEGVHDAKGSSKPDAIIESP